MTASTMVAIFPSETILDRALEHLTKVNTVNLKRAVIVLKDEAGNIKLMDDRFSPREGGIAGGVALAILLAIVAFLLSGAVISLQTIALMALAVLLGGIFGYAIGEWLTKRLHNSPQSPSHFEELAQNLDTGHPALVLELENPETEFEILQKELQAFSAEVLGTLQKVISDRLKPSSN